jgi:MFS family permease
LWQHRDFLLLWSAQGVSAVGSRITRTALPMAAILVAGAGAFELGLLAVALTAPRALVAWFAGGWVDRHGRRSLLIATDLVRAGAQWPYQPGRTRISTRAPTASAYFSTVSKVGRA